MADYARFGEPSLGYQIGCRQSNKLVNRENLACLRGLPICELHNR